MKNEDLDAKGIIAGAVVWLVLVSVMAGEFVCAKLNVCGTDDLIMNSVIAIGFVAPAWFVAHLVSGGPQK